MAQYISTVLNVYVNYKSENYEGEFKEVGRVKVGRSGRGGDTQFLQVT